MWSGSPGDSEWRRCAAHGLGATRAGAVDAMTKALGAIAAEVPT